MKAKALGYSGEALAAQFLQSKGYEIIRRNFTVRGGEIDLIAKKDGTFVFVEVKTRTSKSFGEGSESINGLKRRRMAFAIRRFMDSQPTTQEPDLRADCIEIELYPITKSLKNIFHIEDIELE